MGGAAGDSALETRTCEHFLKSDAPHLVFFQFCSNVLCFLYFPMTPVHLNFPPSLFWQTNGDFFVAPPM